MPEKRAKILLAILTGSFFLLKLIYIFRFQGFQLFEVHDIAVNMVRTGEMKYFLNGQFNYNYQFPVYPFLLFLIYKMIGILPVGGIILNLILNSLTAILAFPVFRWLLINSEKKALKKACNTIALIASLAILIHPLIAYYTLRIIHPFSLDLFLLFFCFYSMIRYFKQNSVPNFLIFCVVLGISILDRGTFIVLIIPFFFRKKMLIGFRSSLLKSAVAIFISFLIISPWLARNYNHYGKFSFNSSFGQNLWLGIQKKTNGTAFFPDGKTTYYSLLSNMEWEKINQLSPVNQSKYFSNIYFSELRTDPALVIKMFFVKIKSFWWFRFNLGGSYNLLLQKLIPVYKAFYIATLFLFVLYIFMTRKACNYLLSLLFSLSILQSVFYVETRHRVIIEPFLIFMAISAIFLIADRIKPFSNDKKIN